MLQCSGSGEIYAVYVSGNWTRLEPGSGIGRAASATRPVVGVLVGDEVYLLEEVGIPGGLLD